MAEVLKKKEIHVFNRFGQNLAFDVNDMHLFEINQLTKEIFQNVDGKTPEELTAVLSDHFPSTEVLHVLSQLMELNLVGYWLPSTGIGTERAKQEGNPEDGIKKLVLFVTQDCNLKCHYCYIQSKGQIEKKYMSEDIARSAVDLLFRESHHINDLVIGFYGGEPMLGFDLIKTIIPYANRKADELHKTIKYTMTTNGTLLTDEAIDFLTANKVNTAVSFDGNQVIHDNNRVYPDGSGSFNKVFPAYTKLKEKNAATGTLSVMRTFDIPLKNIAQSLLDLGIPAFNIVPAVYVDGQLIPTADDQNIDNITLYNKQFEEMVTYFLDYGMMFNETPPIDFSWIFKNLDKKEKRDTNCGAASKRLSVDADGNILPCDHFIGESTFYMGNVLTGLDRHYQEIFKDLRAINCETCRICWARNLCGGWCPFFSFHHYGDLKKPVAAPCMIKKNIIEIAMGVYSFSKKKKKTMPQNQDGGIECR